MYFICFTIFMLSINLSPKVFSCERSSVNMEENLKDVQQLLLEKFSLEFNPLPCELQIDGEAKNFIFYPLEEDNNCGIYLSSTIYNKFYKIMKKSIQNANILRDELIYWKKEISSPARSLAEDSNIFSIKLVHKTLPQLYIYFGTFPDKYSL